jgi:hypothetical protein
MYFNWRPGIGDPTFAGWFTVALYLIASLSCWVTARKLTLASQERRTWSLISFLFLLLGINKQLDLQSALTDAGRVLAYMQGWYGQRQLVQLLFIALVAIVCVAVIIILLIWAYRAPAPTRLALLGTAFVIGFVLIRAASFHHIDRFLGHSVLALHWNWVLECGGISLALLGSLRRQKWH